jgi:hypothetical protein
MRRSDLPQDTTGASAQIAFWGTDGETLDGSSSAATQTSVYGVDTAVRLSSAAFADCYVAIGTTPTAVAEAAGTILVNGTDYTIVEAGQKISVIGGKLNIVSALK